MDGLINKAASIYFHSPFAMIIADKNKKIVSVNSAFCKITGHSQQEVIGCNPNILSSDKHDDDFYKQMWRGINNTNQWSGEIWNKRKNGNLYLEWITITAITNDDGDVLHYFAVFTDITERKAAKAAEKAIYNLTYHDNLTTLPNRHLFLERLERALKKAIQNQQILAVLFLDIDNFKDVNDTLGHDSGDIVIQEIAQSLNRLVRVADTVARFGGDEFTICLTDLNATENAGTIAHNILNEMAKPFQIHNAQVYLSASVGIAFYPENASTTSDLLKYAEQAMFSAKNTGRNNVSFFSASMQAQAITKQEMIVDLHEALSKGEFSINYQPIVEMTNGKVHKAEALLRWCHPTRGWVSPADFIPIAEEAGIITAIGDWVFREAAQQTKKWQQRYHPDFQISINKSPKQFQTEHHEHLDWYKFLNEIKLTSASIVVEITEGLLIDNNLTTAEQLHSFRNKGIKLALDDFGTGYSSLAYLKKFDIDYIKIDQTFVRDMEVDNHDQALCEAIIVMAHKLGIKVIAEGIETKQQWQLLSNAGCDYGQGYLFSKPLPVEQFEEMMTDLLSSS